MYIVKEDFENLEVSEAVKNFVKMIQEQPENFKMGRHTIAEDRCIIEDRTTGLSGQIYYSPSLLMVDAGGLGDFRFVNAKEAKEIYCAIVKAEEVLEGEKKETLRNRFYNAYNPS